MSSTGQAELFGDRELVNFSDPTPTQATLIRVAGTKFDERQGLYVALQMEQCEKWLRCLRRRMAGECGASYILPGRIGTCVNRWELPSFAEMTAACDGTRAALDVCRVFCRVSDLISAEVLRAKLFPAMDVDINQAAKSGHGIQDRNSSGELLALIISQPAPDLSARRLGLRLKAFPGGAQKVDNYIRVLYQAAESGIDRNSKQALKQKKSSMNGIWLWLDSHELGASLRHGHWASSCYGLQLLQVLYAILLTAFGARDPALRPPLSNLSLLLNVYNFLWSTHVLATEEKKT
ncbi:hypothetical protein C8R45DRAFT_926090 [Mycena sanguinolenta]|nr:hypothetical protein C8R45DRAFT_926090 [Mycena sanguinolenta]